MSTPDQTRISSLGTFYLENQAVHGGSRGEPDMTGPSLPGLYTNSDKVCGRSLLEMYTHKYYTKYLKILSVPDKIISKAISFESRVGK